MANKAEENVIIDKFVVPKAAMREFRNKIELSMQIIGTQAGFVMHKAYEQSGDKERRTYLTIVTWESQEALEKPRRAFKRNTTNFSLIRPQ